MDRDEQPMNVSPKVGSESTAEGSNAVTRSATPNPWDDDADHHSKTPDDPDRALTMRLLRPSVFALFISTGIIFLSAVASNNAVASSPLERASLAIHRIGMFGLLMSFVGILISYRLPAIARSLAGKLPDDHSTINRNLKLFSVGLRRLFMVNIIIICLVWLAAFSSMFVPLTIMQLTALGCLGVLGSLAILRRGLLQAYSIGVLFPLAVVLLNWQPMMMASFGAYGMMGQQRDIWMFTAMFASVLTVCLIAGLVSAAFYTFDAQLNALQQKSADGSDRHRKNP